MAKFRFGRHRNLWYAARTKWKNFNRAMLGVKEAVRWTMVERTDCPTACKKGLDGCATGISTFARVEA